MKKIVAAVLLFLVSVNAYADSDLKDEYKKLVDIFFDAVRVGHVGVVDEFLTNGFPVDQRNSKSYTPLMVAAYSGQSKMVDILVAGGADACATDKRGNTALMGALFKGELGIVKKLYGIECDPNATNNAGQTLDNFAEMFGKQEFLQSLGS
ncbi:ankyrin repeat domain-containing protein [Photobacterium leiognathi]|uniref:ankyrin repeat domain-containing protein n=1 Tax=Photobacterium leiognathi TaxID=553611 RepID=UPI002982B474|nr:ankyrin repeat domain-containing protein [Photobacterium leiognathi]